MDPEDDDIALTTPQVKKLIDLRKQILSIELSQSAIHEIYKNRIILPKMVKITLANAYAPVYPRDGIGLLAAFVTTLSAAPLVIDPVIPPNNRTGWIFSTFLPKI